MAREQGLRVCVYGSSSKLTPEPYLAAAKALGLEMARRGHEKPHITRHLFEKYRCVPKIASGKAENKTSSN